MKRVITLAGLALMVAATCTGLFASTTATASPGQDWDDYAVYADSMYVDSVAVEDDYAPVSLNDIRFAGWTEDDWFDNEYIREFRQSLDNYLAGIDTCPALDDVKDKLTGKFIIAEISPHLLGGVYLTVLFIDHPDLMVETWVYSEVVDGVVTGYSTQSASPIDCSEYEFTTEQVYQMMEEHPQLKPW